MSYLTLDQVHKYAEQAGFSGLGEQMIVAISGAETGGTYDPHAQNTTGNSPPSTDRGIVQINSYWHPEVTDACAYDPLCAFKAAFGISSGGTNFSQWATYGNGAYLGYLNNASGTAPTLSAATTPAAKVAANGCTAPSNDWNPADWTQYFLCQAGQAKDGVLNAGQNALNGLLSAIGDTIGGFFTRALFFTLGAGVITMGALLIIGDLTSSAVNSPQGQQAAKTATNVAKTAAPVAAAA